MRPSLADLRLAPAALAAWATALVVVALPAGAVVALGCVAGVGAGSVGAWVVLRRRARSGSGARGHALLLFVAVAAVALAGAVQLGIRQSGLLAELVDQRATVRVIGTVRSEPVLLASPAGWGDRAQRYRLELAVEQISGRGRAGTAAAPVLVLAGSAWAGATYGSRVEATGRLAPTGRGETVALLAARGAPLLVDRPGAVDRTVRRIRAALLVATDGLAPDARGLVPGIAVGDTSRLSADLAEAMRVAGLTHVTAVSGAHFAIIGAAVLGLTSLVGLPRSTRIGVVAVAMVALVLLVHPEPSVLRAAAMGAVGIGGLLLGRPSRAIPSLGATVIALLVADPWLAGSFGFALSVLATAGIVLLTVPIAQGLGRALPACLAHAVAIPFAAQTACAPVIVLLNPALATYAVPANLLAAPALVPATVAGVLAALVAPWWASGGAVLAQLAGWAAWWIAAVARVCAGLPSAQLPWPGGPGGAGLLAAVTVAVGAGVVYRDRVPGTVPVPHPDRRSRRRRGRHRAGRGGAVRRAPAGRRPAGAERAPAAADGAGPHRPRGPRRGRPVAG